MASSILKLIESAGSFVMKLFVVFLIAFFLSLFFGKTGGMFPELAGTSAVLAVGAAMLQILLSTAYRLFSEDVRGGIGYAFPSELSFHIAYQMGHVQMGVLFSIVLYYLGILILNILFNVKVDTFFIIIVGIIEASLCLLAAFYSPKGFYDDVDN